MVELMGRPIVPIANLGSRVPEHGRIRLGVKSGRAMKSIDTFRFTSPDRSALEQIAEMYGGTVRPWSDPKASPPDQFEVITQANEVAVLLPPESLSQWYELWGGGGCIRRCDGVTCTVSKTEGEDWVQADVPCICAGKDQMDCKPYSRVNVVMRGVRFAGVWRMETKGWNAAAELPGMDAMIHGLQENGMVVAKLRLGKRRTQRGKQVRNYVVPQLLVDAAPEAILAGAADVAQLAGPSMPALNAAPEPAPWDAPALEQNTTDDDEYPTDDTIVDAELVDEDERPLTDQARAALELPGAPLLSPAELLDELGDDAVRKLNGLLDGSAKWNPHGKVVRA